MADSFVADTKDSFLPDTPKASEPKAKPGPQGAPPESTAEQLRGALADTFSLSGRPGAVPLAGDKTTKTPLGVVLKPDSIGEVAVREAVMAPLTAASLPARIGAQAGVGALERLTSGKGLEEAGYAALIDGAVSGITEGVLGYAGSKAAKIAKPMLDSRAAGDAAKRAFKWATEAPQQAFDALAQRFPGARVLIPSLDPAKKLTFQEAIDKLKTLEGHAYQQARDEIAYWMNRLDKQIVPKPKAGSVFKKQTAPERFTPHSVDEGTGVQRVAEKVAQGARSGVTRSAADTAATIPADDETGLPIGGMPVLAAKDRLAHVARFLMH